MGKVSTHGDDVYDFNFGDDYDYDFNFGEVKKVFFKSIARNHLWVNNDEVPCLVSGGPEAVLI